MIVSALLPSAGQKCYMSWKCWHTYCWLPSALKELPGTRNNVVKILSANGPGFTRCQLALWLKKTYHLVYFKDLIQTLPLLCQSVWLHKRQVRYLIVASICLDYTVNLTGMIPWEFLCYKLCQKCHLDINMDQSRQALHFVFTVNI